MDELLQPVLTAFREAGIPAVQAMPAGPMPRLTAPKAAVSIESVKALSPGLYEYLGQVETEDRGLVEQYGRRIQAVLLIRIFSPDARDTAGTVCGVLSRGFGGVTTQTITASAPAFDPAADAFITEVRAELTAWLMAESHDEDAEFLDFRLEGEVK